ncbi:uncharacterized protein V6R79_025364 [Siganus canaliculatus]
MLVWEFISRLDELLPVPDFTQLAALLGDAPSCLDECLQNFFPPEDMKAVLEHHRNLGHFAEKDPSLLPMDDCILSSLSLPPGTKAVMSASPACSPALEDPNPPEHKGHLDVANSLERVSRGSSETTRQRPKDMRDSGSRKALARRRSVERKSQAAMNAQPCDETIDLTTPNETADTDSTTSDNSQSLRGGRVLRKRKLSGGVDIPSKKPAEAAAFVDSAVADENSGESPLISIWGDYTDSQEGSFPVITDTKMPWSDEETLNLLDIWGKDSVQRALKGCLKNRHIFTHIAQKMAERGYMRTVEQCQTRIKRLKKCFRQNIKGNSRMECKFYEQLQRVLGSSSTSAISEIAYDVEEVADEEESQDGDDDLQFVGRTNQLEVGTRSVPWTDLETLTLINTWAEGKLQQDLRGLPRTGNLFSIVSKKMAALGFSRTPEQCQTRLKRLKSTFRQCYQNNMKGLEQVECKFYNELGRILVKDFPLLPQLEEPPEEPEDDDFPSFSQQDIDSAMDVQEERKKVPWSDKETIILLEIWGDPQVQNGMRRYPHNGHLFTEVSEKLRANGYFRSAEQCHTRIKRLKSNYRQCRESMSNLSGTDRVDFKFYDLLEQILDKQPSTSSALVSESIEISEDSNSESVPEADPETGLSTEKPSPGSWSDEETLALIEIWGEDDAQRALKGLMNNGHVYGEISERMQDLGFFKTSEQCRWKVKSLRTNFRQCYDKKKQGKRVDYKFYEPLEQILGAEAVSMDEYDDRDEQADFDPGADGLNTAWTERETIALVEVWSADDVQQNLKTYVRNSHIFAEISEKLASIGHLRTAEQCHARINRLKKNYRRFCNGRRSGRKPASFRYFNLLAPVLGNNSVHTDVDIPAADVQNPDIEEQPSASHLLADVSKKTPWSDQETRTLLHIWGEDTIQLTLKGRLKNRQVFDYISEKMSDHGFIRTPEQCYSRIKRLKHGFLHEKEDFKFFSEMDEIFRRKMKMDDSVVDMLVSDEPDDYTPVPEPNKVASGSQAMTDSSKLIWGDGETQTLLEIWGSDEIQENLKSCTKNKHVFIQISEIMASQGYLRTPEQCQTRIKRLRANFRHFLEGRKGDRQECKFFDQLVQVFGSKYVVNTDSLADEAADGAEQNPEDAAASD